MRVEGGGESQQHCFVGRWGGDLEFIQKENDKQQTILSIRTPQRGANVDRDGYFWAAFFIMHQKARACAFWCFFLTWPRWIFLRSIFHNAPKSTSRCFLVLFLNLTSKQTLSYIRGATDHSNTQLLVFSIVCCHFSLFCSVWLFSRKIHNFFG